MTQRPVSVELKPAFRFLDSESRSNCGNRGTDDKVVFRPDFQVMHQRLIPVRWALSIAVHARALASIGSAAVTVD
jgi:hypothetical protein